MDRVQRSGLIALAVLLLTALGAYYVGSLPGSDAKIAPRLAAQDPAAMEGVKFLPPEQRKFFVGPEDFVRPPVRNPLSGRAGRNVDAQGGRTGTEVPIPPLAKNQSELPSPGPATPNPAQKPTTASNYIRVAENDNLTRIAKRELGDGTRWREIASLNQITKPFTVELGQLLWLPPVEAKQSIASAGSESAGSGEAGLANASHRQGRTYRVGQNETASHISKRVYGTTKHWKRILDHNGIHDPRDLKAGQEIKIPPLQ